MKTIHSIGVDFDDRETSVDWLELLDDGREAKGSIETPERATAAFYKAFLDLTSIALIDAGWPSGCDSPFRVVGVSFNHAGDVKFRLQSFNARMGLDTIKWADIEEADKQKITRMIELAQKFADGERAQMELPEAE